MQTGNENETWHDMKPSYTPQPAIVTEAREAAARAWQRVSELSDAYEQGTTSSDTVNQSISAAIDADAWYRDVWQAWQTGEAK